MLRAQFSKVRLSSPICQPCRLLSSSSFSRSRQKIPPKSPSLHSKKIATNDTMASTLVSSQVVNLTGNNRRLLLTPSPANYRGPILFAAAFSSTAFISAAYIYDANQKTIWERMQEKLQWRPRAFVSEESIIRQYWHEKKQLLLERKEKYLDGLAARLEAMRYMPLEAKRAIWMVGSRIANLSEAERTIGALLAINTVVFGLWQIPRLVPFMQRWFTHLPGGRSGGAGASITMVTSCFSHQTLMHFAFNMIGLWSFGTAVHEYLGKEQFLAAYLTFGVGASLVSHVCQLPTRMTRLIMPSLGASGALYGIVATYSVIKPDAAIALIFLPMIPIKLGTALPCMMAVDFLGIFKRWSNFDHFAHLGGAFFGLGYAYFGERYVWEPLVTAVNNARRNVKDSSNNRRGGNGGSFAWTEPRQR